MQIKLCGFSNVESIKYALNFKPDFIGFIFYENSPRNISFKQAKILSHINYGNCNKVAVTVNASNKKIEQILSTLQPDILQLHGNESIDRITEIKQISSLSIIKSLAISDQSDLQKINQYLNVADYLLFDSKSSEKGGSGKIFDWNILQNINFQRNFFLSGGLNKNNLENAKRITNAKLFDISSGIEEKKSIKSQKKIKEIMELFRKLQNEEN